MNVTQVKRKLTKLLALSTSPNEAEAQSAMEKCRQLMAKHNIRTIDVDEQNCTADIAETSIKGVTRRVSTWESSLAAAIAQCFDGSSLIDKSGNNGWTVIFIASTSELNIITGLFKRIRRTISKNAKEYANSRRIGNKISLRHNYSIGMVSTVYARIKKIYTNNMEVNALVIIKETAIKEHIKNKLGKVRNRTINATIADKEAYMKGVQDGYNVTINSNQNRTIAN